MSPLAISFSAFSRLIFDQMLLSERGTNLCRQNCSLSGLACPSIHPWHKETSTASWYDTDRSPESFFANLSHRPALAAWFFSSQAAQAFFDAKSLIGSSSG